jgi:hypothetical protein
MEENRVQRGKYLIPQTQLCSLESSLDKVSLAQIAPELLKLFHFAVFFLCADLRECHHPMNLDYHPLGLNYHPLRQSCHPLEPLDPPEQH